jgi:hypothetical protein
MEGAGRVKCMSGGHDAASDQGKGWGGGDGGEEVEEDIMSEVGGSWQQRTTVVAP